MTRTLDLAPLTTPVRREEVTAFRRDARARGESWAQPPVVQIAMLAIFVPLVLVMLVAVGGVLTAVVRTVGEGFGGGNPILGVFFTLFAVVFLGVLGVVATAAVGSVFGFGGKWSRWLRLHRFAERNGFVFSPVSGAPGYPGAIFSLGSERTVVEHLRTSEGRFIDFGNYRYVTGSGKNRSTHTWGFLAMRLDRRLPHMVLDSRANNGLFGGTNLPASFDRDQVLSLEGDFDRFFTLYCPRQYETDALYVFTPDLMALLIDEAAPFDVEIVDDWLFVYKSGGFRSDDGTTISRLLRIVDTVGAKALRQTMRYADARVGDAAADIVAPQGRRLKRGVSVGTVIMASVFVLLWANSMFDDPLGRLLGW